MVAEVLVTLLELALGFECGSKPSLETGSFVGVVATIIVAGHAAGAGQSLLRDFEAALAAKQDLVRDLEAGFVTGGNFGVGFAPGVVYLPHPALRAVVSVPCYSCPFRTL